MGRAARRRLLNEAGVDRQNDDDDWQTDKEDRVTGGVSSHAPLTAWDGEFN